MLCVGCTAHVVSTAPATPVRTAAAEAPSPAVTAPAPTEPLPVVAPASEVLAAASPAAPGSPAPEAEEEADDEATDGSEPADGEEESEVDTANAAADAGPYYTTEFTDEALTEPWKKNLFTPTNNPAKNEWYFPDVAQMAAHTGAQPIWIEETMTPDLLASYDR